MLITKGKFNRNSAAGRYCHVYFQYNRPIVLDRIDKLVAPETRLSPRGRTEDERDEQRACHPERNAGRAGLKDH